MAAVEYSLDQGLRALGLEISAAQRDGLLAYLDLLQRWNRAYNLTAVRDPLEMVTRHLLDSLSIAPHITGQRFLDVGTGAGLPGIPLAILFPQRRFELLDSNGKKTRFLIDARQRLGLNNVVVHSTRVESLSDEVDAVARSLASSTVKAAHGHGHTHDGDCCGGHDHGHEEATSEEHEHAHEHTHEHRAARLG